MINTNHHHHLLDDEDENSLLHNDSIENKHHDLISENNDTKLLTFEEAVTEIGFGTYQLLLMQVCGAGWFFDGIELSMISFIIPQLTDQWNMSEVQAGSLGSCVFFGMMIGAWFGGIISDRIGRRWIFCGSVFITSMFGLASSFSFNYWTFLFLRFFVGLGLGAMVPTDFSLYMEFIPPANRGAILGVLNIYWSIGAALECLIGWACLNPNFFSLATGWRWCVALSSIPGFIIFISRLFVPESPRFLLLRHRTKEVHNIIKDMANMNGFTKDGKNSWFTRKNGWRLILPKITHQLTVWEQVKNLFSKDYFLGSILLWIIWFMMSYGGWGFNFLLPIVFAKLQNNNVYLNTFYVTAVGLVANIITIVIIDRISRRALMASTFILTGILTACVGINSDPIPVLVISMLANFFSVYPWQVVYTYTPEFYPTAFRATGMGLCSAFTRLAGTITPVVGEVLLKTSYFVPFLTFGIALFVAGVCAVFLPRDTLNVSLEDVAHESHFSAHKTTSHYGIEELSQGESQQTLTEGLLINERDNENL